VNFTLVSKPTFSLWVCFRCVNLHSVCEPAFSLWTCIQFVNHFHFVSLQFVNLTLVSKPTFSLWVCFRCVNLHSVCEPAFSLWTTSTLWAFSLWTCIYQIQEIVHPSADLVHQIHQKSSQFSRLLELLHLSYSICHAQIVTCSNCHIPTGIRAICVPQMPQLHLNIRAQILKHVHTAAHKYCCGCTQSIHIQCRTLHARAWHCTQNRNTCIQSHTITVVVAEFIDPRLDVQSLSLQSSLRSLLWLQSLSLQSSSWLQS